MNARPFVFVVELIACSAEDLLQPWLLLRRSSESPLRHRYDKERNRHQFKSDRIVSQLSKGLLIRVYH